MSRRGPDPLSNEGDMKVFYCIARGKKTQKEIAEALEVTPATVGEHLRKLRKIGIIVRGKKEGKFQKYNISYSAFSSNFASFSIINFLEEGFSEIAEIEEPDCIGEYERSNEDCSNCEKRNECIIKKDIISSRNIIDKIKNNDKILRILKGYLYDFSKSFSSTFRSEKIPTFSDLIENFERELPIIMSKKERNEVKEKKLYDILEEWAKLIDRAHSLPYLTLSNSVKDTVKHALDGYYIDIENK